MGFCVVFLHDVCSQLVMCIQLKRVLSRFHLFWSINERYRPPFPVVYGTPPGMERQLSRQNEPIPGVPSKVRGNVWTPSASQGEANVRENSADL